MPFRPSIRPGAPLVRRDASHLQIGTSPGIVIDDRPGLMAFLRLLDGARDVARLVEVAAAHHPELGDVRDLLRELAAAGALVDASRSNASRPRSTYSVEIHHDLQGAALAQAAVTVLVGAGIRCRGGTDPDLLVVVSVGEPSRGTFERAAVLGIDHLPVVIDEDRIRIGPMVRPGQTPCLSCHDLHRADWDAAWPAIVLQLGGRSTIVVPPSLPPTTVHAAAVELAAEVVAHSAGAPTRATGQCLVVGPAHHERSSWPVGFHPACACHLLSAA